MSNKTTGGIIGLGSRLFIHKETASNWGTQASPLGITDWEGYNIYNQPGSRPQKTMTPIEVSQLYPSAVRRKTLVNTSSVEGSLVFSLPKDKGDILFEAITGDTSASGGTSALTGADSALAGTGTALTDFIKITQDEGAWDALVVGDSVSITTIATATEQGNYKDLTYGITAIDGEVYTTNQPLSAGYRVHTDLGLDTMTATVTAGLVVLTITTTKNGTQSALKVPTEVIIQGITSADQGVDFNEINGTFNASNATFDWTTTANRLVVTTNVAGTSNGAVTLVGTDDIDVEYREHDPNASPAIDDATGAKLTEKQFDIQESASASYKILQTIGLERVSRYDGMMVQSATLNVAPDDVANLDITWIGKDEITSTLKSDNVGAEIAHAFQGAYLSGTSWKENDTTGAGNSTPLVGNNPFSVSSGRITKLKDGANFDAKFDNFIDYFPSYNASLYVAKKTIAYSGTAGDIVTPTFAYTDGTKGTGDAGYTDASGGVSWNLNSKTAPSGEFLIPFSDFALTINNNLDFPTYINGTKNRTQPVQTTYKEITVGITVPYNKYTINFVDEVFDNVSFALKLVVDSTVDGGTSKVIFDLPEVCVTGDGGLGDIPEGEITIPLTFTAYAPVETHVSSVVNGAYTAIGSRPPLRIWVV